MADQIESSKLDGYAFAGPINVLDAPKIDAYVMVGPGAPPSLGVYFMERMDNRIWQTVEDTYAVDCGVSNPMNFPSATVNASKSSGASAVFTTNFNSFVPGNVGDVLRMAGGIATISAYNGAMSVTGDWVLAANNGAPGTPFAAAGEWSLATPVTSVHAQQFAGVAGLVGLADGVPLTGLSGDALGNIALPFSASDVKVGLGFVAQVQTPYLNGQQVVQGARKVIPAATIRLAASGTFQVGTNQIDGGAQNPPELGPVWTEMEQANLLQPTGNQSPPETYTSPGGQPVTQLWTGDHRVIGKGAAWSSKGQVAIQQTRPLPLEVTAVMPEGLPGDLTEVTYGREQQPRAPGRWLIQ